ncbi:MAG TPA: alpha/beta fold hydrolase [Candidatus Solibacter sp.]|nr:alpha/beta fold hydrolase [Candidatus Solibacter sp.]
MTRSLCISKALGIGLLVLLGSLLCAAHNDNGSRFEANGVSIYYEVSGSGSGAPLVVVNGGPGFDHTYLHLSPAWDSLAKNRRVVFYDQRGVGHSTPVPSGKTFTLKDQLDDLEALRAHLGAERIDLLGHSWGGFLAMAYAARYPQHISHLLIMDSAAPVFKDTIFLFNDVFPEAIDRQKAVTYADDLGDKAAGDASIHEYLTMLFYSPEKRDAFVNNLPVSVFKKEVNQAVVADVNRFDLNPEIRKFRFPVLVITGRYDMNVAPLIAYKIHQAITGSRFVVFERSGHLPFYEEPEGFVREVEQFLSAR